MTRHEPKSKSTSKQRVPRPSGSAPSCALEVTRKDGSATASGLADPRSSKPTHVAVHLEGSSLSIMATYHSQWRSPVEGVISLPLEMRDPTPLLPLLEAEQPWKAWPEIEALVRQAILELQVPQSLVRIFDKHLQALRAVRNGPEKSTLLDPFASEKMRAKFLWLQDERGLKDKLSFCVSAMREDLDMRLTGPGHFSRFANYLRFYQELLTEKLKRDSLSFDERFADEIRRLEEKERSRSRMKGARPPRS